MAAREISDHPIKVRSFLPCLCLPLQYLFPYLRIISTSLSNTSSPISASSLPPSSLYLILFLSHHCPFFFVSIYLLHTFFFSSSFLSPLLISLSPFSELYTLFLYNCNMFLCFPPLRTHEAIFCSPLSLSTNELFPCKKSAPISQSHARQP